MSFWASALTGIGATGAGLCAYGVAESQLFTTREVTASVLPSGSAGFTILHLSDLHITPAQTRKINWLRSLAALQPDAVVVTGDFLAHRFAVPAVAEALDDLLDLPGMFVLGSNDYYAPVLKNPFMYFNKDREIVAKGTELPTEDLIELLTDAGWIDLNNKQAQLEINGQAVHARGTDDPHINKDRYADVAGPFQPDLFKLGVTHAPYKRVLDSFVADDADFILAGHTHGGQVCIPFYGALVTNCDLPTGQAKGLSVHTSDHGSCPLHVSAGVGTSPITPIRIACRPEATLITFTEQ